MQEPIEINSENQIAIIDENQIEQFKSLYYLIKGKRDTDITLFTEFKQFSYDSIIELNENVYRKLNLHELVTDLVNVTVGLHNKEIKSFGNWQEFKNSNWQIATTTKYITIEWDFNLILPNQTHKVPQTHTMRVRIGNNLKPSEMIQFVFQGGDEHELEESQAQMSCKIDFINSQICNELKTVVSDWYDALPKNSEDHKFIKFITRNGRKFENFIVLSFLTASIILINYLFSAFLSSELTIFPSNHDHKLFIFLTFSIPVVFMFLQSGRLYADRMMRKQIGNLRRNPMFDFTKGDKNQFVEVEKENKQYLLGMLFSLLVGLGANGITAIIGFIITKLTM